MSTTGDGVVVHAAPAAVDALPAKPPGHNRQRPDLPGERRAAGTRRRLFIAADLDEITRAACASAAQRLRIGGWTGRWVDPANYHVTVAFLGSVDEDFVDEVVAALSAVAPQLTALDVPIDAIGGFPSARRARVAWAGASAPVAAFGTLCRRVRNALAALELPFDQHADPHVTLARAVGLPAELPRVDPPVTAPLRITGLTLYESIAGEGGPRYHALEWLPLAAQVQIQR
jgi:2'-5' RNA ligase